MSNLGRRLARLEALHGKGPQGAPTAEEYMAAEARRSERGRVGCMEALEAFKAGRPRAPRKRTPEELRDESIIRRWKQAMGFPWPEPDCREVIKERLRQLIRKHRTPEKRAAEFGRSMEGRMLETLKPTLN